MENSNRLRAMVERAVAQVLEERLPALREEIISGVVKGIAAASAEPGGAAFDQLNAALASIQGGATQAEILSALLDGMGRFSGRVALFVVRSGAAQGWQARGLVNNETIKTISLDTSSGLAARAVQARTPVTGAAADFDPRFLAAYGAPAQGNVVLIPLVIRDRVAALIYADAGVQEGGRMNAAAAELLVRTAAMWIELAAARKAAGAPASVEVPAAPSAKAMAASAESPAAAPEAPVAASAPAQPEMAPAEEEVHHKARRFAKLLVEEIKLYNQAKVAEGRQKRDLYGRLKDDIEKSRASYNKRYGQTAAAADYFTDELIRILAEGDVSLLGSSFPG